MYRQIHQCFAYSLRAAQNIFFPIKLCFAEGVSPAPENPKPNLPKIKIALSLSQLHETML